MSILSDFTRFPATRFIETGTGQGETLMLASASYPECLSIEHDRSRYVQAVKNFLHKPNVRLYSGDAAYFLPFIIDPTVQTTFWLDAHYTSSDPEIRPAKFPNCRILDELLSIIQLKWTVPPIILIDDYDTFHHGYHDWPKIEEISELMRDWKKLYVDVSIFGYTI